MQYENQRMTPMTYNQPTSMTSINGRNDQWRNDRPWPINGVCNHYDNDRMTPIDNRQPTIVMIFNMTMACNDQQWLKWWRPTNDNDNDNDDAVMMTAKANGVTNTNRQHVA